MSTSQKTFCPANFTFQWTDDNWYTWDSILATKMARQARDAAAKQALAEGRSVKKFSLPHQLITRGGIGSGRPQIEVVATVFGLNTW